MHNSYPGTLSKYKTEGPFLFANTSFDVRCDQVDGCVVPQLTLDGNITWVKKPEKSSLSADLLQATKFGPTVLPIVFAAIASTFLRFLARWKAQRGSRIQVNNPVYQNLNRRPRLKSDCRHLSFL